MAGLMLELKDRIAVVTMDEGENRFNLSFCDAWLSMLDKIERETDAVTLVVKSAHHKIWSNGFDREWAGACQSAGDHESIKQFMVRDIELRRRMLLYPMITIAAINGHVFGAGAIFSCCFDFRFMRSDRGYFCIPAIDLGYAIAGSASALLQRAIPVPMFKEAMLIGRRYTGEQAAAGHVVRAAYPADVLMDKVMDFAGSLNKGRVVVGQMKKVLNSSIIRLIDEEDLPATGRTP